ncbi:MAG: hypothetical protein JXQ27_01575 [Acidobacteria bacterium]|nr:hypothetical protein [Acidobacteriota bacterium]
MKIGGGVQQELATRLSQQTAISKEGVKQVFEPMAGPDLSAKAAKLTGQLNIPGLGLPSQIGGSGDDLPPLQQPMPQALKNPPQLSPAGLKGFADKLNDGLAKMGLVFEEKPGPPLGTEKMGITIEERPGPSPGTEKMGIVVEDRPSPGGIGGHGQEKMGVVIEDRPGPTGTEKMGIVLEDKPAPGGIHHPGQEKMGVVMEDRPAPGGVEQPGGDQMGIIIVGGKVQNMANLFESLSQLNANMDTARIIGDTGLKFR